MGYKLGEFFVDLTTKVDDRKVKDFSNTIGSLPLKILGSLAALGGLDLAFMSMASSTMEMGTQLRLFSAITGESTDELEKWQMVARRVGLNNEAATGSITKMIGAIAQLKTYGTGPAAEMFGRLGITGVTEKSPYELLAEMRDKYSRLDVRQRAGFAQVAGSLIDPNMLLMFSSKWSSPEAMSKMNPLLGKSGIDQTRDLTEKLSEFTDTIRRDFVPVLIRLIPALKELSGQISHFLVWMANNKSDPMGSAYSAGAKTRQLFSNIFHALTDDVLVPGILANPGQTNSFGGIVQNFYGNVDKTDIDAGNLDLEHTLVRTSRMLNRGGR